MKSIRLRILVRGAVQGVGFRPFVFRLAQGIGLAGWVNNSSNGVHIELEGAKSRLDEFLNRIESEKPPRSFIQSLETWWLDAVGYNGFEIRESQKGNAETTLVLPDIATCPDCLAEVLDKGNRRYFYPFTNCTNCGPRFSIIESLPYDRANTSMKAFTMCPQCQAEYENPEDRRFHAQPNACPVCGPKLELWDSHGSVLVKAEGGSSAALRSAADAVQHGEIVAVKGLGGFHLVAAAGDPRTVRKLRDRKHREEKPFAVMFPSLKAVRGVCEVSPLEERLLRSPESPIVLLRRLSPLRSIVSAEVAPENPNLGVVLPYSPLHHLLLTLVETPVVATSGNLSDEPICIDEHEALERLKGIADRFLVHDRPIVRHVDDSIVRVMAGRELVLRRARGYAPLPVSVRSAECGVRNSISDTIVAVGAHLKSAVALAVGPQIFISQHIGDLETAPAYAAFRRVIADLQRLYDSPASIVAADEHPDYLSSKFARSLSLPCTAVQHHVAHVLSCMAENDLEPPVLGVSWDGTGYGSDGTVWGGEFFRIERDGFKRVAHLRQFRLPGGEQAIKEPRRSALGLLFEAFGKSALDQSNQATLKAFTSTELATLGGMLQRNLNSPLTSSVGRLFDAVASLLGLRQRVRFEGQAAMQLEFLVDSTGEHGAYIFELRENESLLVLDWQPGLRAILDDLGQGIAPGTISTRFHNMLVEAVVKVAQKTGLERVALSGGCFQNRYLTEQATARLTNEGFRPYWHQRVPPNDGGICLGQVVAARWWKV